jgi:hypothetical protein
MWKRGLANAGREFLLFSGMAFHNFGDTVSQMEARMLFHPATDELRYNGT